MGLLDPFRGIRRPAAGVPEASPSELRERLLALNGERAPFTVAPATDCDLVAEWRLVDSDPAAGATERQRIFLALDAGARDVRAYAQSLSIRWFGGMPKAWFSVKKRGPTPETSEQYGKGIRFTGDLRRPLKSYEYRFNLAEQSRPLVEVVTTAGWTWRLVFSKRGLRV
jgi:hypothetical protein